MKSRESIFGGLSRSLVIRILAKLAGFVRTALAAAFFGFGLQADSLSVALGVAFFFNVFNESFEFIYARRTSEERPFFDLGIVMVVLTLGISIISLYLCFEKVILLNLSATIASQDYDLLCQSVRFVMFGSVIFLISNLYSSFLRSNHLFTLSYSYELITAVAMLASTIVLKNVWTGLAFSFFLGQVAGCVFLILVTHLKFDTTLNLSGISKSLIEFCIVNSRTILISLIAMLYVFGEKFYGDKLDRGGLAIFNLANLLVGIATSIVPFHQVFSSVFSVDAHEQSKDYFRRFASAMSVFAIFVTGMLFVFAYDVAALAAGYGKVIPSQIEEAGMQIRIISLGILFTLQNQLLYRFLFLRGQVYKFVISTIVAYSFTIAIMLGCYSFGYIVPLVLGFYYLLPAVLIFMSIALIERSQITDLYLDRKSLRNTLIAIFAGALSIFVAFVCAQSMHATTGLLRILVGGSLSLVIYVGFLVVFKNDLAMFVYTRIFGLFKT